MTRNQRAVLVNPQSLQRSLGLDAQRDALYGLGATHHVQTAGDEAVVQVARVPLKGMDRFDGFQRLEWAPCNDILHVRVAAYRGGIVRLAVGENDSRLLDSPMLALADDLVATPLRPECMDGTWRLTAEGGVSISWPVEGPFAPRMQGDGLPPCNFEDEAHFMPPPHLWEALPFWLIERGDGSRAAGFSLHLVTGEHLAGTGERFAGPDLRGRRMVLENENAFGSYTRRAYKNVPFVLSSRGYGVFVHAGEAQWVDAGAQCNQALQWGVESHRIDVFIIGGKHPAEVLRNYRRVTGFPQMPPVWSFGVWMSRLTYMSAQEMLDTARQLRSEHVPVDVLHQDTAWFPEWVRPTGAGAVATTRLLYGKCDWRFSSDRFPDPSGFFSAMRDLGIRVSLWQWPHVRRDTVHSERARTERLVGKNEGAPTSDLFGDTLDLTHAAGRSFYRELLESVLRQGAAAIKADFGEWLDPAAEYVGLPVASYHNLFPLLYQQTAWEATEAVRGAGDVVIWARSGWAGAQRYPVHWAGDTLSTFEGLATTLMGGLHLGMSGFAFWSHDAGGFASDEDFLETPPTEELYLRWTQAAVFGSHLRYHGCQPREPWHFPGVAEQVRQWLTLRYMLLPYILEQASACCTSGLPMMRALALDWPEEPAAWVVGDQFLFGESLLVCPILEQGAVARDVWLPPGTWVDWWTGEPHSGPRMCKEVPAPLERIPLYVRSGATILMCEPIEITDALKAARHIPVVFDESYDGWRASEPGGLLPLE